MKKYYIKVVNEYGDTIFDHSSDNAEKLVKMLRRASHASDGNMWSEYYFAKTYTNIPEKYL